MYGCLVGMGVGVGGWLRPCLVETPCLLPASHCTSRSPRLLSVCFVSGGHEATPHHHTRTPTPHPTPHLQGRLQVVDLHAEFEQVAVKLGAARIQEVVGATLDVVHHLKHGGKEGRKGGREEERRCEAGRVVGAAPDGRRHLEARKGRREKGRKARRQGGTER